MSVTPEEWDGMNRRERIPLTKSTGVYVSVSLIAALVGGGWLWGTKWKEAEARDAAMLGMIEDVADRQLKYIGQGGTLTKEIEGLDDTLDALKLWLQRQHPTEEIPR